MTKTIRAKFRGGVIEPLEPVDLPENEEVVVTVVSAKAKTRCLEESLGMWTDDMIDVDSALQEIYAWRQLHTRPEITFDA